MILLQKYSNMAKALAEYNPLHHYEEDDEEPQEFNTTHRILNNVTLRDLQSEGKIKKINVYS